MTEHSEHQTHCSPLVKQPERHACTACADCGVRTLSICRAVAEPELWQLDQLARRTTYAPRSLLFREREPCSSVFVILSGMVRLSRSLADGRRQILGFALASDFLGLSLSEYQNFTAETIGGVDTCRFERKSFTSFIHAYPQLMQDLHAATANQLAIGREQILLLGRRTAEEKLVAFLLGLRRRYRRLTACDVTLPLPMPRQDIADYCGLTLETVSRRFSELERKRLIGVVPGGVQLLMLDRLEAMLA